MTEDFLDGLQKVLYKKLVFNDDLCTPNKLHRKRQLMTVVRSQAIRETDKQLIIAAFVEFG